MNQDVQFTDTSNDPEERLASWNRDFRDGHSSTTQNPVHKYGRARTYAVTLTVTNNEGASDTKSVSITVQAPSFWVQTGFYLPVLGVACVAIGVLVTSRRKPAKRVH